MLQSSKLGGCSNRQGTDGEEVRGMSVNSEMAALGSDLRRVKRSDTCERSSDMIQGGSYVYGRRPESFGRE